MQSCTDGGNRVFCSIRLPDADADAKDSMYDYEVYCEEILEAVMTGS